MYFDIVEVSPSEEAPCICICKLEGGICSNHINATHNIDFPRAEARGIYSSLKEVDLLAKLPLEVVNCHFVPKTNIFKTKWKG